MSEKEAPPLNNVLTGFDSFSVVSRNGTLVKTATFMTYDLEPCVFTTTLWNTMLFFHFAFIEVQGEGANVNIQKITPDGKNEIPISGHNIILRNFDIPGSTYSNNPMFVDKINGHNLYLRIKSTKPLAEGNFREISLSFYFDNQEGLKDDK